MGERINKCILYPENSITSIRVLRKPCLPSVLFVGPVSLSSLAESLPISFNYCLFFRTEAYRL